MCFGRTAEIVRDYVKKGTQLFIEGKIQTRSWDDKESGQKKYRTEILVNDLSLLGGRNSEGGGSQYAGGSSGGSYSQQGSGDSGGRGSGGNAGGGSGGYGGGAQAPQDDFAGEGISDDDIPF